MHRLAVVLAILLLTAAAAPVAGAQIGPTLPAPTEEPPPPPPPQRFGDEGFSALQQVLIFGSAVLVLGVIAFVIVRDARRAAPPDERPAGRGSAGEAGAAKSARARQRAQRAKRQKAKAARQQRKRNRPG
jgi:hypothetical protein